MAKPSLLNRARLIRKRLATEISLLKSEKTGMCCLRPFHYLCIGIKGITFPCCPGLVTLPLGFGSKAPDFERIWNGPAARVYRKAMLSTKLSGVCNRKACPFLLNGKLPMLHGGNLDTSRVGAGLFPDGVLQDAAISEAVRNNKTRLEYTPRAIVLSCDLRCNLACSSCRSTRTKSISADESAFLDEVLNYLPRIGKDLLELEISGSGEVFYSPFSLNLLRSLNRNDFPKMHVHIVTNGQLLTPVTWESLKQGKRFINRIDVSVDAATKSTYESIRIGGKWERLRENLDFVSLLRRKNDLAMFALNFVISARNFREIPQFIELGETLGADLIMMTELQDWGSAMRYDYMKESVHLPTHPLHGEYRNILKNSVPLSAKTLFGTRVLMDDKDK